MSEPVTYTSERSVAVLRMDDGKANALSTEMIAGLRAGLTRAEAEAKAVVLVGRPGKFNAGFDLRVMMSGPEQATALLRDGADLLMRLYACPLPVVHACTGHALAGGALVLLTGDVRVGVDGAFRLGLNEVAIGMPVPVLAMELARDRLSAAELGRATLQATVYDPAGAVRAGYLDELADEATLVPRALEHAARLGELSRSAYAATKARLRGRTIAHITSTFEDDMQSLLPKG
ncbi:MAG: crotonase/enoyl-CoA hydratase family protein [Polyangiaceae bacterium]|nr:crotonase/enoyl-CoA hydratase family protein [Polyangiaceae bacterium]